MKYRITFIFLFLSTLSSAFACTVLNWQGTPTNVTISANTKASPAFCVDPIGNGISAWEEDIAGTNTIFASIYSSSGGWSTPLAISSPGIISDQVQLCCFPNGDAVAVWRQSSGGNFSVWSAMYSFGIGWLAPTQISSGSANINEPKVTCSETDTATAAWNNGSNIEYAYFNGVSWLSSGTINTSVNIQSDVDICEDGAGNAVAVWDDTVTGEIKASTFTPPSTWSPGVIISSPGPGLNDSPTVGCDSMGNAVAVWYNNLVGGFHFASHYNAATNSWTPQTTISTNGSNIDASDADICMDADGNALIVMRTTTDGANNHMEGVLYDSATGTFNPSIEIGFSNNPATNPKVCCGPCDSIAIWELRDNTTGIPYLQAVTFNGTTQQWVLPTVNVTTTSAAITVLSPQLGCDEMGNAYVLWNNSDTIQSIIGYCPPDILNLSLSRVENRFPFQTECFYLLRWSIDLCSGGIASFQIFVDGVLIATVPGGALSFSIPANGSVITVRPVNILGIVGPGQTIIVN